MILIRRVLFFIVVSLFLVTFVNAEFTGTMYPDGGTEKNLLYKSIGFAKTWTDSVGKNYIGHLGDDFLGDVGTSIFAIADGVVNVVYDWPACPRSQSHGWGGVIIIRNEVNNPYFFISKNSIVTKGTQEKPKVVYTQYSHIKNILVNVGDKVKKGQKIAEIAYVCNYVEHLHFEIKDQYAIDNEIHNGVGKGYSGVDNYAPHHYSPSIFIENNKDLIIEDELPQKTIESQQSFFQKLSSFFTSLFTQDETEYTLGNKIEEKKKEDVIYIDAEIMNKNQDIYAEPGSVVEVVVQTKNTGSSVWQQKNMSINVAGGEYKNSIYKHESWITNLRTTLLDQTSVDAGQEGNFTFNIVIPDDMGDYQFQAMIVRQQGYSFTWVGHDMFTIQLHVGKEKPLDEEDVVIEKQKFTQDLGEKVKQGIKGIKETTEHIVDDIVKQIKKVPMYFGGGGGSSSDTDEVTDTDTIESDDIVDTIVTSTPDILILYPTSTPYITTATSTIIFGSYNDDVQHVWVNGAIGDDMVYDNENKLWYFTTDLDIATNTFSFVGWNDDFSTSSSAYEMSIIREEEIEEKEIMLPELSVTTPSTTSWTVTSTDFIFSGIFNSSTNNILVNSTTTVDLDMNTSTFLWTLLVTVSSTTSTYDFVAIDDMDNQSATTSIIIILEEEILDEEGPKMTMLSATMTDVGVTWSYMATDTLSDVVSYGISFSVAPDSSYNENFCGGDTVWYETDDIAALVVVDDFYTLFDISPCILFTTTTSDTQLDIMVDSAHELLVFDMDVSAIDSVGNKGSAVREQFEWGITVVDDAVEGSVVISEIAWMGTEASFNDEWFELCNIDEQVIDMSNWYISWGNNTTTISNLSLDPNDCVVFERTDQTTISDYDYSYIYTGGFDNTGEHIILYSSLDTIMDEVDASDGWFAGENDTKDTMIRINPNISGNMSDNWCSFSSCSEASMHGTQYGVDADGNNISGSVGNWEVSYNAY